MSRPSLDEAIKKAQERKNKEASQQSSEPSLEESGQEYDSLGEAIEAARVRKQNSTEEGKKKDLRSGASSESGSGVEGTTSASDDGGSEPSLNELAAEPEPPKPGIEPSVPEADPEFSEHQQKFLSDMWEMQDRFREIKENDFDSKLKEKDSFFGPIGAANDAYSPIDRAMEQQKDVLGVDTDMKVRRLEDFANTYNEVQAEAESSNRDLSDHIDLKKEDMIDEMIGPVKRTSDTWAEGHGKVMAGEAATPQGKAYGAEMAEKADEQDSPQAIMKREFKALKNVQMFQESRETLISTMGEEEYTKKLNKHKEKLNEFRAKRFESVNEKINELEKQKEGFNEASKEDRMLQARIDQLKGLKSEIFTNDPGKAVDDVAERVSSNSDAVHALDMTDPDMDPKERFEAWYYTLYKQNRKLGSKLGLLDENGEFRRVPFGNEVKNILGRDNMGALGMPLYGAMKGIEQATGDREWGEDAEDMMATGVAVGQEEERFRENERLLRDLAPVFFLNTANVGEDKGSFFGPFFKKLDRWYTDDKLTRPLDRESAQNVTSELSEMGVGNVNPDAMESLSRRAEPSSMLGEKFSLFKPGGWLKNWDPDAEAIGETSGMLTGAISMYMIGRGAVGGVSKVARGRRLKKQKEELNRTAKVMAEAKRRGRYDEFVKSANQAKKNSNTIASHFTPTMRRSVEEGITFEATGEIFKNREDEFNFATGFAGMFLGNKLFEMADSKITKNAVKRMIDVFGDEAPRAMKVLRDRYNFASKSISKGARREIGLEGELEATGRLMREGVGADMIKEAFRAAAGSKGGKRVRNMMFRGGGETAEETVQELTQVWRESEKGQNFFADLRKKFGEYNRETGEYELALKPIEEFLITTFAMGSGFGAVGPMEMFNSKFQETYDQAADNKQKMWDAFINDAWKGNSQAMVRVNKKGKAEFSDEVVGDEDRPVYKIDGQELSREDFLKRIDTKQMVDQLKHGNSSAVIKNDPEARQFYAEKVGKEPDEDVQSEDVMEEGNYQEGDAAQDQEEEVTEEETFQTVREMEGRPVDHEDGTGILRIDDEGNVSLDPIEEGGARVSLGKEENVSPDEFEMLQEEGAQETPQREEESVDDMLQELRDGDENAPERLATASMEGADRAEVHRKVRQELDRLSPNRAQKYGSPQDQGASQTINEIRQMAEDVRSLNEEQRQVQEEGQQEAEQQVEGQQEASQEQQQETEQQQEVDQEQQVEGQQEAAQEQQQDPEQQQEVEQQQETEGTQEQQEVAQEETQVDTEQTVSGEPTQGLQFEESQSPVTMSTPQRESMDRALRGTDQETADQMRDLAAELAENPGDESLIDEADRTIDRTNMSEDSKASLKALMRDIGLPEQSSAEQSVESNDPGLLAATIREDIQKIRDRSATPSGTGIGKKLNQLRKMDEEAYEKVLEEYRPVIDEYTQAEAQTDVDTARDRADQLEGPSSELADGYVKAINNTSVTKHPDSSVDLEQVAEDYRKGRIDEDQLARIRSAYDQKKARHNDHRRHSGDSLNRARKQSRRQPDKSTESVYGSQVMKDLIERLQKAFPNIEVERKFENVRSAYERMMGREVEDGEVPAGFHSNGRVYLNEQKMGPDTAFEEFAHLWLEVADQASNEFVDEGINALMESDMGQLKFREVISDPAYSHLTNREAKKEALAQLIGQRGAQLEEQTGFKKFIRDLWDRIKRALGIKRRINFGQETLRGYVTKVAKDLRDEVPITQVGTKQFSDLENGNIKDVVTFESGVFSDMSFFEKKIKRHYTNLLTETFGQPDVNARKRKMQNDIKADMMRANEHIVPQYQEGLKAYFKRLKDDGWTYDERKAHSEELLGDINESLTGNREAMVRLPKEVLPAVRNMRYTIDEMSRKLRDTAEFLDDDIKAIITEKLGIYVHRAYRKHQGNVDWTLEDALAQLDDVQRQELFNHISDTFFARAIDKVRVETSEGATQLVFINKHGFESKESAFRDTEEAKEILSMMEEEGFLADENRLDIEEMLNRGENGTYELSSRISGKQPFVSFDPSADQVEMIMRRIAEGEEFSTDVALSGNVRAGGLAPSEKGALKKRKDIDPALRVLMGEITDPAENFVKTVSKISNMLHKSEMEQSLVGDRTNTLLSRNKTSVHTEPITKGDSEKLATMFHEGDTEIYTTPEMKRVLFFDRRRTDSDKHNIYAGLVVLNGVAKANLTLFAPDSQSRNFFGGMFMLWNAGVLGGSVWNDAISSATSHFNKKHEYASSLVPPLFVAKKAADLTSNMDEQGRKDLFLKLMRLGLADESVRASIIDDASQILGNKEALNKPENWLEKGAKGYWNATDFASRIYQSSDLIPKAIQFLTEREEYARALSIDNNWVSEEGVRAVDQNGLSFEELTEEQARQVEEFTADRVRVEQPTYTETTQLEKDLSKFPFAGAFVTFTARRMKNQGMILKHIWDDGRKWWKTGNRHWLQKASKKSAGVIAINGAFSAAAYATSMLFGWDEDELEAISRLYPGYAQNSTRLMFSSDKRNPSYIDMTFMNPNSHLHKMFRAAMRGEDWGELQSGFFWEAADPFIGNEIFFKNLRESLRGRDQYENEISKADPSLSTLQYSEDVMAHSLETLIPKIFYNIRDTYRGARGVETHYGKRYSLVNELTSNALGVNQKSRDVPKMLEQNMMGNYMQMEKNRRQFRDVVEQKNTGDLTGQEQVDEAYEREIREAMEYFKEIRRDYEAAQTLGLLWEFNKSMEKKKIPHHVRERVKYGVPIKFDKATGGWWSSDSQSSVPGYEEIP